MSSTVADRGHGARSWSHWQRPMTDQVSAICRAAYYQLRQLRTVTRCLTPEATKTTVQAFISCRLDYCNALLYGTGRPILRQLQSVQNAADRLVAGSRRSDHITPVLRRLHWLPVRRRIEFKLALLIYKSLHGLTPRYLSDDCQLVSWCWPPSASLIWCLYKYAHVWSRAQTSVTRPSKSLDPDSGTICRLHCVSPTRQSAGSRNCWRLDHLFSWDARCSDCCFYCAVYKYFYYYYC